MHISMMFTPDSDPALRKTVTEKIQLDQIREHFFFSLLLSISCEFV